MSIEPYQYLSDIDGLAGEVDPEWGLFVDYDGGAPLGIHDTTLFDENESVHGYKYDEATGLPYDNSNDGLPEGLHEVYEDDISGFVDEETLLLEVDPNYFYFQAAKRLGRMPKTD